MVLVFLEQTRFKIPSSYVSKFPTVVRMGPSVKKSLQVEAGFWTQQTAPGGSSVRGLPVCRRDSVLRVPREGRPSCCGFKVVCLRLPCRNEGCPAVKREGCTGRRGAPPSGPLEVWCSPQSVGGQLLTPKGLMTAAVPTRPPLLIPTVLPRAYLTGVT